MGDEAVTGSIDAGSGCAMDCVDATSCGARLDTVSRLNLPENANCRAADGAERPRMRRAGERASAVPGQTKRDKIDLQAMAWETRQPASRTRERVMSEGVVVGRAAEMGRGEEGLV